MNKQNKINHIEIMDNILTDAKNKGWEVLKRWTADDGWCAGMDTEYVVLMRGKEIVTAHYLSFNRGLMKDNHYGGSTQWDVE